MNILHPALETLIRERPALAGMLATPDGDAGYLHLLMGEAYGQLTMK